MSDQKTHTTPELDVKPVATDTKQQPAQTPEPAAGVQSTLLGARLGSALSVSGSPPSDANLLKGSGVAHSTGIRQRAAFVRTLQRRQGNGYVQRAVRQAHGATDVSDESVQRALADHSPGRPLDAPVQQEMESRFGHNFEGVRVHSDTGAAKLAHDLNAEAFTRGQDIYFAGGEFDPEMDKGKQLLVHELTHVVQQQRFTHHHSDSEHHTDIHERHAGAVEEAFAQGHSIRHLFDFVKVAGPAVQRQNVGIPIEFISRHDYRPLGINQSFRVGDVRGPNILMKIEDTTDRGVVFYWYSFHDGIARSGTWRNWHLLALGDPMGKTTRKFAALARQIAASQWADLWPDPVPRLLEMYEAGTLEMDEEVVMVTYRGRVAKEARRSLEENEQLIDEQLNDPKRVQRLEEYAAGLKEASIVRDALELRKSEIKRRLALSQQQFHIGLPKRQLMAGVTGYQRMRALQEQFRYQETLSFWYSVFPLLSRLKTDEINADNVFSTLIGIKASIIETRRNLVGERGRRPTLDPWELQGVRGRLESQFGPKTRRVVKEEEASRRRWAWFKVAAATSAGIALLFLPGGIFIDVAIGVAIAVTSWRDAQEIGHAANTGLHVDAGLMAQAQAKGVRFGAILATIFAVLGVAAAGLRILRSTRAFLHISRTMPQLSASARMRLARMFAKETEVLERLAARIAEEEAVLKRIREALGIYADDAFRLRQALKAISEGFTGDVRRAWMHGLHPDALDALVRATDEELETISRLARQHPEDAPDILRQLTYKARKAARRPGHKYRPPEDVGRRLTESLENLAVAVVRGYPYGFRSLEQFRHFGRTVRKALPRWGLHRGDPHVHGSALTNLHPVDVDVAVLVNRADFDRLTQQFSDYANSQGNTKLAKRITREAAKGKLRWNRFGPREPGFALMQVLREAVKETRIKKVDLSLILKGGERDVGPYIQL